MSRVGIAHHHSAITVGGAHPTAAFSWTFVSPRLMTVHPKIFQLITHCTSLRILIANYNPLTFPYPCNIQRSDDPILFPDTIENFYIFPARNSGLNIYLLYPAICN